MCRKYSKFNNYELFPFKRIDGFDNEAFEGYESILDEFRRLQALGKRVFVLDFYPGVNKKEVLEQIKKLNPKIIIDSDECTYPSEKLNEMFEDNLGTDRVFGIMCYKNIDWCFDSSRIEAARKTLSENNEGTVFVIGTGAGLITEGDCYIYFDLARWEIQLRYRDGMSNWRCENADAPILSKYKRGFFIEWRLCDRYKKDRIERFDYIVDTNKANLPKMISGEAFRFALDKVSKEPFRVQPYFDPGVWGGQWMKQNFSLPDDKENYAWSFDGVPEENSLNLKFGEIVVELPSIDLVLYKPRTLLGERVHARFGTEFPIRFDFLDTVEGGNLSLQVHPLTEYIQQNFGMHYTQDESYYLLDAIGDETYVYLGLKENVDKSEFERELRLADKGGYEFPVEKFVNKIKVKKHDHVLIPSGTIHCSGENTMVLEISATPYIFTFKLWDWSRVGLDGLLRPIHIDHGLKNIQWDRDTNWVMENLVNRTETIHNEDGLLIEKTGLHEREFIETIRYSFNKEISFKPIDSVRVLNLIDGGEVTVTSSENKFEDFVVHYAETFIIPASAGEYKIKPTGVSEGKEVKLIEAWVR